MQWCSRGRECTGGMRGAGHRCSGAAGAGSALGG